VLGTVEDDELPIWYHAADALAFPSVNEGWGLVVLEAMAAGLPVVATDIPVLREYLTPDRDALLVAPGDDADLAAAITRLAQDRGLRERLAAAGRTVAAGYEWSATAARHDAIYARIVAPAGDHARTGDG
jgi:glycosyltransferase involved in cell wall biosynthesis